MYNYSLVLITEIDKTVIKMFDCGVYELNFYLKKYALKNDNIGIGKTFVAMDASKNAIGYCTLASAEIKSEQFSLSYKLPQYPIPATRIARLAVHKDFQGKGIGKWLLGETFKKIIEMSKVVASYCVIVDVKDTSKAFYEHCGFMQLKDKVYFIPIETIKKAFL